MTARRRTLVLSRPREIAALTSPIRQELFSAIGMHGPVTVRRLAALVGRSPTALYHHLALLEGIGAIAARNRSGSTGRVEAEWTALVDRVLIGRAERPSIAIEAQRTAIAAALRLTGREVERALARRDRTRGGALVMLRGKAWLAKADLAAIRRHFDAVEAILHRAQRPGGKRGVYSVLLGLVPVAARAEARA